MAKTEVVPKPEEASKPEAAPPKPEAAPQRNLMAQPRSLVEATPLSVVDEFHGQGGSYLLDPATGIRTLVERTKPAPL